jgi:hypothetical protein
MTLDEAIPTHGVVSKHIAKLIGLPYYPDLNYILTKDGGRYDLDSRDCIAALIPAGWTWLRKRRLDGAIIWTAACGTPGYGGKEVSTADTGDEVADRARLLLAMLELTPPRKEQP